MLCRIATPHICKLTDAGKVMEFAGKPNIADFIPILRWLDPQGLRRNTQFHVERAFEIAGSFIKERMETGKQNGSSSSCREEKRKDFLDVLLEFRGDSISGPYSFSPRTINVIVFVSLHLLLHVIFF